MFNACDKFNRALHDRKWPHKHGGRNKPGDNGLQHNFAFSCVLQNTFNAYEAINEKGDSLGNYSDNCLELSIELFEYACNIVEN